MDHQRQQLQTSIYLRELLQQDRDYLIRWQREVKGGYSTSLPNKSALSRVVFNWLEDCGENPGYKDARVLDPTIGKALNGERLSPKTLEWIVGAFQMSLVHRSRLFALLQGDELGYKGIPPIVIGAPRQRDADSQQRHYDVLAVLERHEVGRDGIPVRHRTFQVLRSTQDELASYPLVFDTAEADVAAVRGGTLSHVREYGRDNLMRADFTFPSPISAGELVSFEVELTFQYDQRPDPNFIRKCERKDRIVDIAVQFAEPMLPESVRWFSTDLDATNRNEVKIELDEQFAVHCLMELVTNSYVGIEWTLGNGS